MTLRTPKKRIGLVSAWSSRSGGGVFEAVVAHCEIVRNAGFQPVVIALADKYSHIDRFRFGDVELITIPVAGPSILGFGPGMAKTMIKADLDLLHLHGIWMYPSAAASAWAKKTGRPYIISPHGMLDPWIIGRGKLKKAVARIVYEKKSWARASCFHALTESEARDIEASAGAQKTVVIPNAIRLGHGNELREPIVAYLGRIHPKKNIDGLISGWQLARDVLRPLAARLCIAGWGEPEHVQALRTQIAEDGGEDIEYLGPLYGAEKAALIGSARFLALPSHSEGLPVVILEAWASGTPTLMSRHCHLPEGYEQNAALDCGTSKEDIAATLRLAFSIDDTRLLNMQTAASQLILENFTPEVVSLHWRDAYHSLIFERQA